MKISICIPQYNRIKYLQESLRILAGQAYKDIEVVISDDCSTDETQPVIQSMVGNYVFPIRYKRQSVNLGYDRNLREAVSMATGDYVLILGNDDAIDPAYDLGRLVAFLEERHRPEVGFVNYREEGTGEIVARAFVTDMLGSGPDIAMRYYSCFSFVGGLVIRRDVFEQYNTDRFDGSIFAQIYLCCRIVASGHRLFSIAEVVVIKDVLSQHDDRLSYRDTLPRGWTGISKLDAGMTSVLNVVMSALEDSLALTQQRAYRVVRKMYLTTYPYWLFDYRKHRAIPAAVGLIWGMFPGSVPALRRLHVLNRFTVMMIYSWSTILGLLFPVGIYERLRPRVYQWIKR